MPKHIKQNPVKPASIEVRNSDEELEIQWNDGHLSIYPLFGLRKNCPCAGCRGGHSRMGHYDRSLFFVNPNLHYEVEDIKQIGNHAIQITWNDGHNTGMYQWETLRNLCPCEKCYPEQK
jgi:DUF971 family protein